MCLKIIILHIMSKYIKCTLVVFSLISHSLELDK